MDFQLQFFEFYLGVQMIDFACQEFRRCLREIEEGNLEYIEAALELVDKYSFSMKELNRVLEIGARKRYEELLRYIRNGYLNLEKEALGLCMEYGFSYERLWKALKEGERNENKLF